MNIIGISAYTDDNAACLIQDGRITAAAREEWFASGKNNPSFPEKAFQFCLQSGHASIQDIDHITFYEKPLLKLKRILQTTLADTPIGVRSFVKTMSTWFKYNLWIKEQIIKKTGFSGPILFSEHLESQASSAFFSSPFKDAAFLILDDNGDCSTTGYGIGTENRIIINADLPFQDSLGLLYSAFSYHTGFRTRSEENHFMELSSFGESKYTNLILSELLDLKDNGSFKLNKKYFQYVDNRLRTNEHFDLLFRKTPRQPSSSLTQADLNIACSIQHVIEEIILRLVKQLRRETRKNNLCLSGNVFRNPYTNSRIAQESIFDATWIQPATGNNGAALGAALLTWHRYLQNARSPLPKESVEKRFVVGPSFSNELIREFLQDNTTPFTEYSDQEIPEITADLINDQKIIGWFQGPKEYGHLGLGYRSILGDPRSLQIKERINSEVKFRQNYRLLPAVILEENAADYFKLNHCNPYQMSMVQIREELKEKIISDRHALPDLGAQIPRSAIPAVTHVNFAARIQTVNTAKNPLFYNVVRSFYKKYGCPVIVNSSFNIEGEPSVCSPDDAYSFFCRTGMDCLLIGNFLIEKNGTQ